MSKLWEQKNKTFINTCLRECSLSKEWCKINIHICAHLKEKNNKYTHKHE